MWLHSSPLRFDDGTRLLPPSVTGRGPRTFAPAEDYSEGVLETRQGSGCFIVRLPSAERVGLVAIGDDLEQLHEAVARIRQQVAALVRAR